MPENAALRRLKQLQKSPLYVVGESGVDWYRYAERAKIANNLLWLRFNQQDRPVKAAFDFFGLNHSDPRHWRILILYLSLALFPNPRAGSREKTMLKNAELLARSRNFPGVTSDSELARLLKRKYRNDYKGDEHNLRKRLRIAREQEASRRRLGNL